MGFLLVMKAELVRNFIIMRRYWFRTVIGMAIGYGMLLMLILGFMRGGGAVEGMAQSVGDPARATSWALGFIVGMFAFGIVGMFTMGLQGMAQNGQLEQLCMSPHGLVTNFLARAAVASFSSIFTSAFMVWLIAKTVGGNLYFDPIPVLVLFALTFTNLIGFGFMVGGLVLVFKQTGQLAVLVRLSLFGLAILATDSISKWPAVARWLAHALPITDAAILLKYVLIQGQHVMEDGVPLLDAMGEPVFRSVFMHSSFPFLLISCVVWTLLGVTCFRFMEDYSRTKGTLGAY